MRYASKKEEKMGILPVMNPLFNLREICKQSALLEDHLNNPRKRCPDCIRKHFLTIEALYEEAISLDKKFEYDQYLDGKAQMMRDLQGDWLDAKDTKKYHSACETISQSLRKVRKEYAPICFDVRKMASFVRIPKTCVHRIATLSQVEKEERETERLVRQKPKKKPPAKHKMRKRMKVEDPDLENLGGGAGGDRDLSMNHKRVASSKKVAIAFLVEASAERKVQRNKAKKKDKDQDKSERKQRDKEVRERLESDDKPYIMSEAGNKVTFLTAINADKKNRERKSRMTQKNLQILLRV